MSSKRRHGKRSPGRPGGNGASESKSVQVKVPMTEQDREEQECPLRETHDKLLETHHFLTMMMREYHEPAPFRWNLNAFLQALRSVTFILQHELSRFAGFKKWYIKQRQIMRQDPLLRAFVEGRNIVVKERNLLLHSKVEVGIFRRRKLKLVIPFEVSADIPSSYLLKEIAPKLELLDEEHTAIGEEYGVKRVWQAPELGSGEVLSLCDTALSRIGRVFSAAHTFIRRSWPSPPEQLHDPNVCNLLTETDMDPTLVNKWGW